jgi:hypothetical protein
MMASRRLGRTPYLAKGARLVKQPVTSVDLQALIAAAETPPLHFFTSRANSPEWSSSATDFGNRSIVSRGSLFDTAR